VAGRKRKRGFTPSNPQIYVGGATEGKLAAFEATLKPK